MFGKNYIEAQADWVVQTFDAVMPDLISKKILPQPEIKNTNNVLETIRWGTSQLILVPLFIASPVLKPIDDVSRKVINLTQKMKKN